MKNLKQFSCLVLFLLIVLPYSKINGQFRDAALPTYFSGLAPVIASNTGNDILELSGTTYEVSVWDDATGSNGALLWKVGSNMGTLPIGGGGNIVDPDVCFVKNNSNHIFILVAYYDSNTMEFRLESYYWAVSQQQFYFFASTLLAPGIYQKSVNIGSNDGGDFAIVWDEPGNQISLMVGTTTGAGVPTLSNGGSIFNLQPGSDPDVCVYRNATTNFRQVDVAYIEPTGVILVDFYSMSDLNNGVLNPDQFYRTPNADLIYKNPRIACPSSLAGGPNDFTLVAEDTDNCCTWMIKGFNWNSCCNPPINISIYNDGGTGNSPYNLMNTPNDNPVVCYDQQYTMTWIAWNVDNSWGLISSPGATISKFSVAVTGNRKAVLVNGTNYLYVPNGNNFGSVFSDVSLSGSNASQALFTYHDGITYDVFSKSITHQQLPSQLRTNSTAGHFNEWMNEIYSLNDQNVSIKIYDLMGRMKYNFVGEIDQFSSYLISNNINESTGIFMIHARSEQSDGNEFRGKLIFGY